MVDFSKSGRIDNFAFYLVDCNDLKHTKGELGCKVVGGSLEWNAESEMKTSGSLTVVDVPYRNYLLHNENLIRVVYQPTVEGEKQEIILGTYYFSAELQQQMDGYFQGTLTLKSALYRWKDDILYDEIRSDTRKDGTIIHHGYYVDQYLEKIVGDFYMDTLERYVFEDDHILTPNIKALEIIQWMCEDNHWYYGVDEYGFLTINKYHRGSKVDYTIKANNQSVIDVPAKISSKVDDAPNMVLCQYTWHKANGDVEEMYGRAVLKDKERRSIKNLGRRIVEYQKITDLPIRGDTLAEQRFHIQRRLNGRASSRLFERNQRYDIYEFSCYYQPLYINQWLGFEFGDLKDWGIITKISLEIGVGAKMRVQMEV